MRKLYFVNSDTLRVEATIAGIPAAFDYGYGNVKRLKRYPAGSNKLLWYMGDGTIGIVDLESRTVIKKFGQCIHKLEGESLGFMDVLHLKYIVLSTYAKEKRMLYLYSIEREQHVMVKSSVENPFKSTQT